ncbi:MAG: hypothetical protein COW19_04410 [Zetaproteobacteria bacterium CG12_big_fil_rev_8_21_14_0_65_55_1124]|nr:MAG: hypothetical protein AUJ58_06955 [Zetaproteobacteria bacterium CG1_02_55_237]PIS20264.1 MAG: hypothetical protein COT53_01360 [Zetaproteobacteria bacterium CG08_land_8_20_14_0_20_55_17]PIW43141.1 MAG: hypothetical protein COW19_04410 [Zetaproteobacteria bacterium CG12_big_fil_rev_8_21_14_0_65_55_1124]PIY52105.1 MAG: hypothetical protein COZ01_08860 [Zetaproteobacteria bacterium CG_4_10_14_0_8_um_filter_55_43]PIZ38117.1 MAG: hypothetical protein COY36_07060 [Zetaproteobacteria bacterium 
MNDTATASNAITYFHNNRPAQTFLAALKSLATQPREFFAGAPFAVFYGNSLFFASIIIFILTFLAVPSYSLGMLFMLPVTWGSILIGMYMLAAYMSWGVKAFTGVRLTPANAFQLSAYAFAPMMFVGLSWAGLAAFLYSMYLLWLGLTAHCRIAGARAVLVLVVPVLIVAMIGGAMMFALGHLKIS